MVLASNEWLNNTEDEEKPQTVRPNITTTAAATATTTTPTATATASASTTTSTNSISTVTNTTTQSIVNAAVTTLTTTATTTTTSTTSSSNSNNISGAAATVTETSNQLTNKRSTESTAKKQGAKNQLKGEKRNQHHQQQQQQQQNTQRIKQTKQINSKNSPPPYDHQENKFSIINVDNILSVMSENTAVESIRNSDTDSDSSEGDNNNLLNTSTASNTTITNDINNVNSNTNTPQSSLMRQSKSVPSIPLSITTSNSISPQALSTALKTVMSTVNGSNNNNNNNATNNTFVAPSRFGSAISDTIPTFAAKYNNSSSNGTASITNNSHQQDQQLQRPETARAVTENNGLAKILLLCEASSHPFQPRTIFLTPNVECKVGRLIAKSKASDTNAIFDCKVLSRNHAVLWYSDDGKFWVKDTKSSNGTYINENKLGNEGAELHFGDTVKFGVDVLENSRKEVHGCIIACVKLYLPDGREAISIDLNTHRALYSGEGIITFDELRRLNLYMQEASQRELVLQSKLFNIQNVLDATRKNSALCWQSMVGEDQLLHRIHLLEKKLQIMEKNVPESALRNEIFKLLEDKSTYQNQAKESLRKVYQERCDAMQLLSKMESAYLSSDNECKILREQIAQAKETIQDVNNRLTSIETEYNDYKDDVERQQLEASVQDGEVMVKLIESMRLREYECDDLKRKIEELMSQNAAAKNRNQDADDDDDVGGDGGGGRGGGGGRSGGGGRGGGGGGGVEVLEGEEKRDRTKVVTTLADVDDETIDIVEDDDDDEDDEDDDDDDDDDDEKDIDECFSFRRKRTLVSKSTSVELKDLLEAENNDGVVVDANAVVVEKKEEHKTNDNDNDNAEDIKSPRMNANNHKQFAKIMENIKINLKQLNNHDMTVKKNADDDIDGVDSDDESDNEDKEAITEIVKANDKPTDSKKYALMQTVIALLYEAHDKLSNSNSENAESLPIAATTDSTQLTKQESKPLSAVLKGNYKLEPKTSDSSFSSENSMDSIIEVQHKSKATEPDKEDDIEVLEMIFTNTAVNAAQSPSLLNDLAGSINKIDSATKLQILENEIIDYRNEIFQLNDKLELLNKNAKQSEELIETEYNTLRNEIFELTELSASLLKEKMSLENTLTEIKSQKEMALEETAATATVALEKTANVETQTTGDGDKTIETVLVTPSDANSPPVVAVLVQQNTQTIRKYVDTASNTGIYKFEEEMRDDFAAINSNVMQREEELITYKEYLEQLQTDNIYLRNEIANLKVQANSQALRLLKRFLPYAAVFLAIVVYFLSYHY